jgi:hypothetical protein
MERQLAVRISYACPIWKRTQQLLYYLCMPGQTVSR